MTNEQFYGGIATLLVVWAVYSPRGALLGLLTLAWLALCIILPLPLGMVAFVGLVLATLVNLKWRLV